MQEILTRLGVRWQVEILFRVWKSHARVDEWRSRNPWRILCELYAKLAEQVILHRILLTEWHRFPDRSLFKAAKLLQKLAIPLALSLRQRKELREIVSLFQECFHCTRHVAKARARYGSEYEVVAGDVEDQDALLAALQGCQGVHINLDGGLDPDLERRGAEKVAAAAARAGIQRITYLSGASVSEENCWYPGTRAKFAAEAALRASGLPYTIFRATFFMEQWCQAQVGVGGRRG